MVPSVASPVRRLLIVGLIILGLGPVSAGAGRADGIRARRQPELEALAASAGLRYPLEQVYLRAFKRERLLEVWAGPRSQPLRLVKTYPFCAASGDLGPKRAEGDLQVPEGLYEVSEFNPGSSYHLSMKVSYPNASDRARGRRRRLGGLIYLHGRCASIGCIAIEDGPIEEVYLMALDSKVRPLRFDIFPMRLDATARLAFADSPHLGFWRELTGAYINFELSHRPAPFRIDPKTGAYVVEPPVGADR